MLLSIRLDKKLPAGGAVEINLAIGLLKSEQRASKASKQSVHVKVINSL